MKHFLFIFGCFLTVQFSYGQSATNKLHEYLIKLDVPSLQVPLDKKVVEKLFEEGANLNTRSQTGANAIHLVIEAWAVNTDLTPDMDQEYLNVVQFLLEKGSNPNQLDYRGYGPAWYLLGFGSAGEQSTKIFNLLIKYGLDLNKQSDLRIDSFLGLVTRQQTNLEDIERYIKLGLDLKLIDLEGKTFAHFAAMRKKSRSNSVLVFEYLLKKIEPKLQFKFATKPTINGMTPLHFAAMRNNIDVVKYLIEIQKVPQKLSDTNRSPLDLAILNNAQDVVKYFRTLNSSRSEKPNNISCTDVNSFAVTYKKLTEIIQECDLRSINDLLKILPAEYRSNYVLSYYSNAVQSASPSFPHVTLFGHDAKLMMAFNGHKDQVGYYNLEIIEFDSAKGEFDLREIKFPQKVSQKVTYSEKNPTKCLSCHGNNPRPLWDSWTFWPGKFGSEVDAVHPIEAGFIKAFTANKKKGRYKFLLPYSSDPLLTVFGTGHTDTSIPNTKLDLLIESLMAEKIVSDIKNNKSLIPFHYMILAGLSCHDEIEDYLPLKHHARFKLSYQYLLQDTLVAGQRELKNRLSLLTSILGELPQSRYVYQQFLTFQESKDGGGRNFDTQRVAKLRYVANNLRIDMSGWFSPFNNGLESYLPSVNFNGVEFLAWRDLIDPVVEPELFTLYKKATVNFRPSLEARSVFFQGEPELRSEACSILKRKSQQELNFKQIE